MGEQLNYPFGQTERRQETDRPDKTSFFNPNVNVGGRLAERHQKQLTALLSRFQGYGKLLLVK